MRARDWCFLGLLAMALPATAQVEVEEEKGDEKPPVRTEKLWRLETSGIGG